MVRWAHARESVPRERVLHVAASQAKLVSIRVFILTIAEYIVNLWLNRVNSLL